MKKLHKRDRGFTLMELLVTVAIVGILAILSMPAYGSVVDIALAAACKYNQKYLESLLSFYLAEHNESYVASDLSELKETVILTSGASSIELTHTLYDLTKDTGVFECPAAHYYKVSLNGHYVTDGYVVVCATDNHRSRRSDGAYFALDAERTWPDRSWNHSRD